MPKNPNIFRPAMTPKKVINGWVLSNFFMKKIRRKLSELLTAADPQTITKTPQFC